MNNKKLISMAVGAMVAGSMGVVLADDLDVFKPREGDVASGANPTVYFLYQPDAEGYLIDLVGPNSSASTCDGAVAFQGYITRKGADCLTTAGPANTNPDVDGGDASGVFEDSKDRVCEWKAPSLAAGDYKLSVTGFDVNSGGLLGDNVKTDKLLRDGDCAAPSGELRTYQSFKVASVNVAPSNPAPKMPVAGVGCAVNTPGVDLNNDGDYDHPGEIDPATTCRPVIKGAGPDGSVDGSATWVQVWINDKDGFNLTQAWYQIATSDSEAETKAVCKLNAGVRTCVLPDQTAKLAGGTAPYTWWTRLWNPAGASGWSAAATMTD